MTKREGGKEEMGLPSILRPYFLTLSRCEGKKQRDKLM